MAILLSVLAMLSVGFGEFFAGDVTKRARANEVTSAMFLSGALATAVLALFWPGEPTGRDLVFGALAGVTNGVAILLLYIAYSRGSLRSAAPAAAVVMSGVPVVWDVLVAGGALPLLTWAGIGFGAVAIALLSYERGEAENDRLSLPLAILAGVIFGSLFILLGEIGDGAGGTPILVQRAVGLVVAFSVTRATGPRLFPAQKKDRLVAFIVGLFTTAAVVLVVLALQSGGSLSIVSVIASQYAAVAVLMGFVLRGQRLSWWQTVGLIAASLSVALITLG